MKVTSIDISSGVTLPYLFIDVLEFGHFEYAHTEPRRGVTYQPRATPWVRIDTEIEP
jgi:hypothetical protein